MKRFPAAVRVAMQASGAAATCIAVQLDGDAWEAALFLQLAGPECKDDRRLLRRVDGNVRVGLEADIIEHASAAVVVLGLEVHTGEEPLHFEVLLTPGEATGHFETLKLLTTQPRLCWFFADGAGELLHAQHHALEDGYHSGFESLLADALQHDRLIRLTGRYDANAALSEITSRYQLRAGVGQGTGTA